MEVELRPCRVRRAALRAERQRQGRHTLTGRPLVNRKHPELRGLPRWLYEKLRQYKVQTD